MIKFSSVTKEFGNGTIALDNVSFSVDPGELVLITGPSGSGKTTLMRLLIKEYLPTDGEIMFGETPLQKIRGSSIPKHRRQIGVVFQDYKLLPELNVWENIALPLYISNKRQSEIESRVTDLLTLTNMTDKAWVFPSQLSGGEAQRVSIARALATGPSVIFADEPTGNLDAESSKLIVKLLAKINELGTTLLFATHDPLVLELLKSHRHLNFERGKLTTDSKKAAKSENSQEPLEDKSAETTKADKPAKTETAKSSDESEIKKSEKKAGGLFAALFKKKEQPQEKTKSQADKETKQSEAAKPHPPVTTKGKATS